jgi:hypothetical protein
MVDVAVNLRIFDRLLERQMPGGFQDYLGLLLADSQVAFGLLIIAWIIAPLALLLFHGKDVVKEAVVLLSTGLAALFVVSGMVLFWRVPQTNYRLLFLAGLVSGIVLWIVLRFIIRNREGSSWSFGDMVELMLFPTLIVSFTNVALATAFKGGGQYFILNLLSAVLSMAVALLVVRTRSPGWKRMIRWLPVGFGIVLMLFVSISFKFYGRSGMRISDKHDPDRPDVVLIVLDTVRADHLKSYGYSRNTMPKLENWAENALVFKRAIAPSGWTAPTHASLFSGLPVSLHGIHGSEDDTVWSYTKPLEGITWLPERLSKEGYYCLAVSSNHHALPPGVKGFESVLVPNRHFWLSTTIGAIADHFSPLLQRINEQLRWRMPYEDARGIVDIVFRAVPEGDGPVFLFINFLDAHAPYNPPSWALNRIGANTVPLHLFGKYRSERAITALWKSLPDTKAQYIADLYDGELMGMDRELGRLLDWIDQRFGNDTTIIVTSDHGEELGERGKVGHSFGLSQALIHVPLIVRSPTLPNGEHEQAVNLRSICDFVDEAGAGQKPGVEVLQKIDQYGIVAERYMKGYDARTL